MSVRSTILIVLFIGVFWSLPAQKQSWAKKRILAKAEKAFQRRDFLKAYSNYQKYLAGDSVDYLVLYKAGLSLYFIKPTDSIAMALFQKSKYYVPESHFYLGRMLQLRDKPEEALVEYYHYKTLLKDKGELDSVLKKQIVTCEIALLARNEKEFYAIKNLGPSVNSAYPEYVPLLWNHHLIFTSRRPGSTGGKLDPYQRYYEDIYIAAPNSLGFDLAKPLSKKLNTETHDACVALSVNGENMILYRTDETELAGDLLVTRFEKDEWAYPVKFGSEINSDYLETSACYSADGDFLIFSSDRPGGFGGRDLYKVARFSNGQYSMPQNLGGDINSSADEDAPFLDWDNNKLYFSSNRQGGMGEYDLYTCAYDPDKQTWTKSSNLGQPLNSAHDDIYFFKPKDSNIAYFTSRREGGYGDADIYQVNFSESTMLIANCRLLLVDSSSAKHFNDLSLSLVNKKTQKLEGIYKPNKEYGTTILLVEKNKAYELHCETPSGYHLIKDVTFNDQQKELIIDLKKQP